MSSNRFSQMSAQEMVNGNGKYVWPEAAVNGTMPAPNPPSANGANGEPAASAPPDGTPGAGRDARGRFARGNLGGPGNPFARQVAALRQAAVDAVSADDVRAIIAKMTEKALAGDVAAAKVVLSYAVGRPAAAPEPDRLDIEEWDHFKATAPMMKEAGDLVTPDSALPIMLARAGRQARTRDFAGMAGEVLGAADPEFPSVMKRLRQEERKRAREARGRGPCSDRAPGQMPGSVADVAVVTL
jgi:hypothetical protein